MQAKLKLNLEDLKVESFDTTPGAVGSTGGTVFGLSENTPVAICPCENESGVTGTPDCNSVETCNGCATGGEPTCNQCELTDPQPNCVSGYYSCGQTEDGAYTCAQYNTCNYGATCNVGCTGWAGC
jgi:hypothetical protein